MLVIWGISGCNLQQHAGDWCPDTCLTEEVHPEGALRRSDVGWSRRAPDPCGLCCHRNAKYPPPLSLKAVRYSGVAVKTLLPNSNSHETTS